MAFGDERLRWRRSRGDGTFDTVSDLFEPITSFDVSAAGDGTARQAVMLVGSRILVGSRSQDGRLSEVHEIAAVPLSFADQVRLIGPDTVYVWDLLQRNPFMVGVSMETGALCRAATPGEATMQDVGFFDADDILDVVTLRTCSYCTSSYTVFLGNVSN